MSGFLITIELGDNEVANVIIYNIYNTVWCGFAKERERTALVKMIFFFF